jgi:Fe-S oxidoreductase
MAYTHLAGQNGQAISHKPLHDVEARYTIHDPCTMRFENEVQDSIRDLVSLAGGIVVEMNHSGAKTLCCGEGGAVGFRENENKNEWQNRRKNEAGSLPMVTYCAGCTVSLHSPTTKHILDIVFPADAGKKNRLVMPPFTYLNRILFKRKMASHFKISRLGKT